MAAGLAGCGDAPADAPPPSDRPSEAALAESAGGPPWFVDRAAEAGLDFVHVTGHAGEFHQPEIMGPGAGLLDYDNDGDLDVYLVQSGYLEGTGTPPPADAADDLRGRLFRNDLQAAADGSRTLRFTDVTEESGLDARAYGMGVAAGDYDNDGCVDLYLTHYGPNQLYRNDCDGTFTDVSRASGTDDPAWSVPASFVDIDRDGWLDLFVGNYLVYVPERQVTCASESGLPDYCPPERYRAAPDRLYRNRGDGTFADVTLDRGLAGAFGPALGVATADFDGDGWIDVFVANDQQENQLWLNRGGERFEDVGLMSGTALGATGALKADMGVDAGDFDNDGDEDLFMTDLTTQGSTFYVNDGSARFEEQSARAGIRLVSLPYTGFGAGWFDYDNDGWLDLLAVNGLVTQNLDALGPDNPFPLQQPNQLLRNLGDGRFADVTAQAGPALALSEVSRGAAFGDIDNDGDTDVVIANAEGPVRLLVNEIGDDRSWLGLRLVGDPPGGPRGGGGGGPGGVRDMPGARVEIVRDGATTLWRRARADGSYASANDPRVLAGLGDDAAPPALVRVTWPSGAVEEWSDVPVGRYTTLVEGSGSSR
ncbi:MAG: CRTAC1 family protein [Acidobacteria bacterium]|nr:CRTAC1 family protein [Acidobacteriota bacterium]